MESDSHLFASSASRLGSSGLCLNGCPLTAFRVWTEFPQPVDLGVWLSPDKHFLDGFLCLRELGPEVRVDSGERNWFVKRGLVQKQSGRLPISTETLKTGVTPGLPDVAQGLHTLESMACRIHKGQQETAAVVRKGKGCSR